MNKFYLVLIALLIIGIAVLSLSLVKCRQTVNRLSELPEPTAPGEATEYPNNLLEGTIIGINLEEPVTLIIAANVSRIVPEAETMEKDIQLSKDTKVVLYDMVTKEEKEIELSELKPNDFILVATQESTWDTAITQRTFTALRITKMVGLVGL